MQNYITVPVLWSKVKKVLQQSRAAEQSSVWCAVCGGELGWAVDMWAAGDIIVTRCVPTLQPPAQSSSAAAAPQAGHPAVSVLNSVK